MSNPQEPSPRTPVTASTAAVTAIPVRSKPFVLVILALLVVFSWPLYGLVRFALGSELYSYVLLVPFASAYLVWIKKLQPLTTGVRLSPVWAVGLVLAGGGTLAIYLSWHFSATPPSQQDSLALAVYSLVLLLAGVCCGFLDRPVLRRVAFPLFFLVFMAPLPVFVETSLETFLQHGSSIVAQLFFQIIGTPVFRDGTLFHLPGFSMQVARECSGIHSTLALFITSLIAGQVLLRSTRSRVILALAVLPIALLRNGLRVTTIGELCVRIGPEMIHSYIHQHGGPIFFILSLVPCAVLLLFLIKLERPRGLPVNPAS